MLETRTEYFGLVLNTSLKVAWMFLVRHNNKSNNNKTK